MINELTQQLRRDEGVRPNAYQDTLGFWTVGVGRLVDAKKPGGGLRDSEIDLMLSNDIADRVKALDDALPWFELLDSARQGVMLNMAFQMGTKGLLAFTTTIGHIRAGRYADAATAMLDSTWAKQTPARAGRLAAQMATGEWK